MNSRLAATRVRVGAQRPTHLLTPDQVDPSLRFDFSDGDDCIALAAALGLELLDWQRWAIRWILAVDQYGNPACRQVIIIVPRQNGKGAILEALELYWLIVAGIKVVVHTAHEADTAAGHQERLDSLISEPAIDLPRLRSYKSNGKERIRNLDEKLLLQFRTRTKATKRGASPQRVILDEAQELQAAHLAALVPAMAAQSMNLETMPQLIYTGSAPLVRSVYLHGLLKRIEAQRPARTFFAMWACTADDDPADVDNWYLTNPSLGLLISEDYVRETEFLAMEPVDFMAERLGVPQGGDEDGDRPISLSAWSDLVDGGSVATESSLTIGMDAPLDRSTVCFSVSGVREDGLRHGSIRYWVHHRDLGRVVEVAKALAVGHGANIFLPPKSPAAAWREDIERALEGTKFEVVDVKAATFWEAQGVIEQAVEDGLFRHRGQPEMTKAVAGLAARVSGDSSPWSRRSSSVNVAPLFALAAALAGAMEKPRPANYDPLASVG